MPTSTITSKGQITIPKEVRSHLGVAPGDRLDFAIGQDGSVRITLLSIGRAAKRPDQLAKHGRAHMEALPARLGICEETAGRSSPGRSSSRDEPLALYCQEASYHFSSIARNEMSPANEFARSTAV